MDKLSVDHLLGIKYLKKSDINLIFKTAIHFKEVINRPIKKVPTLRDMTIANLFFENSTRTKISFELAQKRLGADIVNFSSSSSSVKKGESLTDTVNNILAMKVDMIEKHPLGSQAFIPMKETILLTFVAPEGEKPNLEKIESFIVPKGKGVNYKAGVWHFPLISTEDMDFLVVDRKGSGDNLVIENLEKEKIILKY